MEDSIIVNYVDGTPMRLAGTMISDVKYPAIGLREQVWVNKAEGYSVTLKIRELDDEAREIFGCHTA